MDSQKTTTLGVALIVVIFLAWFFLNQPANTPPPAKPAATTVDTTTAVETASSDSAIAAKPVTAPSKVAGTIDSAGPAGKFSATKGYASTKTIETPLFTAQISGAGGTISSFILKNYLTYDKQRVQLVNKADYHGGDIALRFVASDGKTVSTNDLPFTLDSVPVALSAGDSTTVRAVYRLDSSRSIEKTFRFSGAGYLIGIGYVLKGLSNDVSGYHYTAALDNALPYVEKRSADESTNAKVFSGIAGETEDFTVSKPGLAPPKQVNGDISFIGARTQYFEQAAIPVGEKAISAELIGKGVTAPDGGVVSRYTASMNIPIRHLPVETLDFNYYLGPLEYDRVSALGVGLEQSMNFGWSFLVRPISIHLMMPLFLWLHSFMSNWGLVIIVFSILIKLITIPLSTGQMRSMRKMQVLQPKVTEVREKFKDDAKKMNEELLKLYRTYGVNPAGGCLPMVLQMPILFALYSVLRNVIQLRQAPFAFWISDLSIPDSLIHFGTKLPLIGEQMSGLTLLLVITMFVQQMFTVTDPRQKQMAYIMPIVFIFMFNNLPSGVALYYFMFNIFGLAQQFYLTKIAKPMTLEQMKVDPKKAGGGIMAKLQDMEKSQRAARQEQYAGKGPGKPGKKR